jgi:uncharacterized protein YktA (UPF0223 family)
MYYERRPEFLHEIVKFKNITKLELSNIQAEGLEFLLDHLKHLKKIVLSTDDKVRFNFVKFAKLSKHSRSLEFTIEVHYDTGIEENELDTMYQRFPLVMITCISYRYDASYFIKKHKKAIISNFQGV